MDIVLTSNILPEDGSLPAIEEAQRILRPGGRLIVVDSAQALVGILARDDVLELLAEEAATIGRLLSRRSRRDT